MTTTTEEATAIVREMLALTTDEHHEAILTTVNAQGCPHAAWMGTVSSPDFVHLITVTGAHTDKVANIRAHPKVEWMFTAPDRKTIVYFEGTAEVVVDEALKNRYFQWVPEESRQFFARFYRHGGDWCVIKTRIEGVLYCAPGAYTKVRLSGHQLQSRAKAMAPN